MITAHLRGGPHDGKAVFTYLGKEIRMPGDNDEAGRYILRGKDAGDNYTYVWQPKEAS